MHVCLSHWSALECWRQIRLGGTALTDIILHDSMVQLPLGTKPSVTARQAHGLAEHLNLSLPLQLYLPCSSRRNSTQVLQFTRPRKSNTPTDVCELEDGVYLLRPEMIYAQLSQSLDVIERAKLGYELMSSYVIREGKTEQSSPLVSAELLLAEGARWSNRCCERIERDVRYILPHAESPAEINLAIKLFLPMRYGGLGMKGGELNPCIALSEKAQSIVGKSYCRADILFPDSKLDIEYDSRMWHHTQTQHLEDMKRRLALKADGYDIVSIDSGIANNPERFNAFAAQIALKRNMRLGLHDDAFLRKQRSLFDRLGPCFTPIERFQAC